MKDVRGMVLRLVIGGALFFPVLTYLFWLTTPLGVWGAAYLTLLLELLPVLALAQLPLVDEEEELPRIPVYLSSGCVVLALGWGALLAGGDVPGPAAMGLAPLAPGRAGAWAAGLLGALLLLLGGFHLLRRLVGFRESTLLERLLPRTWGEKGMFAFLSLAAGLGEELAFRGYLIPVLGLLLGSVWVAAVLSSAVFGLLHAYQGWVGIARTALMGLILAVGFILSGSLWPAILAHAGLDLLAGLVFGDFLLKE